MQTRFAPKDGDIYAFTNVLQSNAHIRQAALSRAAEEKSMIDVAVTEDTTNLDDPKGGGPGVAMREFPVQTPKNCRDKSASDAVTVVEHSVDDDTGEVSVQLSLDAYPSPAPTLAGKQDGGRVAVPVSLDDFDTPMPNVPGPPSPQRDSHTTPRASNSPMSAAYASLKGYSVKATTAKKKRSHITISPRRLQGPQRVRGGAYDPTSAPDADASIV